ncbi:MAG TPA: hypothetical protein VJ184_10290, partial [Chryseolinea sp.]|nr:hypothetical protein [Chryseolinea sp.]
MRNEVHANVIRLYTSTPRTSTPQHFLVDLKRDVYIMGRWYGATEIGPQHPLSHTLSRLRSAMEYAHAQGKCLKCWGVVVR